MVLIMGFGGPLNLALGVRNGRCGRWLTSLVCAAVLALSTPAFGQATPDELARQHFESGVAYLQESDYDSALRAFEKAYELSKRPEILLNVATVHERRGDLRAAVGSLKQYVEAVPDGEQTPTVKTRITNLEKRIATEPADAGTTPPPVAPTATAPATAPAPKSEPPPAVAPESKPNRIPAYVLLSVGGLSAAGAVLTGVLAQSEYNSKKDDCSPGCTDDEVSTGKNMALVSTILTGVAVVGVGVGAALLFTQSPKPEAPAARKKPGALPRVFVGVGPRGAAAEATWSF
jgi:tetratricopeptide (TPR) repeat protein